MKSIMNFRSFNNLKTKENARIQENKLFRSAAPEYGSQDDLFQLKKFQLNTVIDFRDEHEKQISLQKSFNEQFNRQSAAMNVANFFDHEEIKRIGLNQSNIDLYYKNIYRVLPTHFHSQYQILAHALNQGQTLLFHCSAGKDRTGFAAYLILSALGVHQDDIMDDYLRSNEFALALYESRKNEQSNLPTSQLSKEIIQRLFGVQEVYLDTAIQSIQENYKGSERYLSEILQADIHAIRSYYLI
ncbi:tyrosine-protein phosphatase [Wohlfahrtiimonas larvae]|uniref:Tyrosine-protein phosphatase n=1 Tax=Wohlfahrtiimonas larvae TaxID=1157986 RepID=A0ABP9MCV5_9GAMM|nr:tyrosine-protein phosphatase [Wohlfahrtiimonas larvae]